MRTEDGTIIQKCLNGESEAFGILIDKYKAGIFALIWHKLHNFHDAEEVTQEVFIKAYKHLRTLRRWDSFAVWLYSIAHENCRKWFRTQLRRPDHDLIEDNDIEKLKEANAIDSCQENDMYDSLHEALNSLPKIYQEVLTLHYFGGMTGEEIAKAICISPSTVRQRLSRARAQLKEEMVAMMSETLKEHKLQANFTFRIIEIIKKIKINPVSITKSLPYGLSLVVGIVIVIMSFNPSISKLLTLDIPTGFPLPVETQVLKFGEIPVDTVNVSQLPALSSEMGKGKGGDTQNAFFLAPQAEGGTWLRKGDMPIRVGFHSISEVNGKIYIIGGQDRNWDWNLKSFSSVYEYDPKTDTWTKKADMPTARTFLTSSVVTNKIYVFGGSNDNALSKVLSTVEIYNPSTDTWAKSSDLPIPMAILTSCAINEMIYIMGGINSAYYNPATVEIYNTKNDKWSEGQDMPTGRISARNYAVLDGKIYAIGGNDNNNMFLSDVWEFTPEGLQSTLSPNGKLPTKWGTIKDSK